MRSGCKAYFVILCLFMRFCDHHSWPVVRDVPREYSPLITVLKIIWKDYDKLDEKDGLLIVIGKFENLEPMGEKIKFLKVKNMNKGRLFWLTLLYICVRFPRLL